MATLDGYDASAHQPLDSFEAIPDGEYRAIATDSEMKETKSGQGSYLQIAWEIIDGEHKGRKLWSRLNLENNNQTAVDIAQRELSSICRAVGVLRPKDSAELHSKPIILRVGHELRKDTGENSNRIKGYKSVDAPPSAPSSAAGAASTPAVAPWRR